MHSLRIECLAIAVPESIRVNIGELQIGQAIHVKDVKLPEGVKVLDDPDAIVVHVTKPQAEAEAGSRGRWPSAEPEVIAPARRKRKRRGSDGRRLSRPALAREP